MYANPSCRLRGARTFFYLESVGSVLVLGIFYLPFWSHSPSFYPLFWPPVLSLKGRRHKVASSRPTSLCVWPMGRWWETRKQAKRVRVFTPHPRLCSLPSGHCRPALKAPAHDGLLWGSPLHTTQPPSEVLCFPGVSATLASFRSRATKTSHCHQPQCTAPSLLFFLNPAHTFVNSL